MSVACAGTQMPKSRPLPPPKTTPFTAWLRDQLRLRGWTHAEFAERVGVAQPTATKWLNGQVEPTPSSMQRIADALYVDIDDVLDAIGLRPQVVYDDPRLVELINMLRAIQPSEDRLGMLKSQFEHMLEYDRQRAEGQRRHRKAGGG